MPTQAPRAQCQRVCSNTCARARDGRCSDGWVGDSAPEGKPSCMLGTDCQDCGPRRLCTVPQTSLRLPASMLRPSSLPPLQLSQILFMIMGSYRYRKRSQRAYFSWCKHFKANCIFFADNDAPLPGNVSMPVVKVSAARPPKHCCVSSSDEAGGRRLSGGSAAARGGAATKSHSGGRSKPPKRSDFFCDPHRARTLRAQYRFLPALSHVKTSSAFAGGAFSWVLLVDDDSFVFVPHVLWLLRKLDEKKALYLGDFGSSSQPFKMGIPAFACGGAGSVFTAAALRHMDLHRCIRDFHSRCMQSDWMIGGCARRHNVTFVKELGCGMCDPKHIDLPQVIAKLKQDRCFFAQNAQDLAASLPLGPHSPAIIHGLNVGTASSFFRNHFNHDGGNTRHARSPGTSSSPHKRSSAAPILSAPSAPAPRSVKAAPAPLDSTVGKKRKSHRRRGSHTG